MSSKPPLRRARHNPEGSGSESPDTFFPATPIELRRAARPTAPRWVRSGAWVHVFMEAELEANESDGVDEDDATRFFDRTLLDASVPAPRTAQDTLRCPLDATRPPGLGKRAGMSQPPAWLYIALTCVACGFSLSLIVHTPEAKPAEVVVHSAPASVMAPRAQIEGIEPALAEKPALAAIEALDTSKVQARARLSGTLLSVTAQPWMEVIVDGKSVGTTPQHALDVGRGHHELKLRNRDFGISTRLTFSASEHAAESHDLTFD